MKTSNKILIILILMCLGFIGAIPITLRYRLKTGDYTRVNPGEAYAYDRFAFTGLYKIVIQNISDCTIIPSDSFNVEIEKSGSSQIELTHHADTLVISTIITAGKALQKVRIFVPGLKKIRAMHSNVLLRGSMDPLDVRSYEFELLKSKLSTLPVSVETRIPQFLDQLSVVGMDSARLDMSGSVHVNKLIVSNVSYIGRDQQVGIAEIEIVYNNIKTLKSTGSNGKMETVAY